MPDTQTPLRLPPLPQPGHPLLIGFSGGLDSTVLLQLLASDPSMRRAGLRALHVHHGLHADADVWAAHCERECAALGIALAEYPLLSAQGGYARHDPALLAQAVMELYRERTVRIYRGTQQYITEEQEWK